MISVISPRLIIAEEEKLKEYKIGGANLLFSRATNRSLKLIKYIENSRLKNNQPVKNLF